MKSKKTVLVVDDDKEINGCIRDILKKDFNVLTAFSGEEGLGIFKKNKVSLVILDHQLPDMKGTEVLQNLKAENNIPVIMITGHGDKDVVVKCLRYRADYYFDKPFSLKELRNKVREILNEDYPYNLLGLDPSYLSPDIRRAMGFIVSNLSNPVSKKLTLKAISEVTNVSPKHLSVLFRKECGQGIYQVINSLKIEKIKELLNEGKDIKGIALELGFNHINNFRRFVKKITGKVPSKLSEGDA